MSVVLFDIIMIGMLAVFMLTIIMVLVWAAYEDTDTFRAIDEKIAKLIRGKEE